MENQYQQRRAIDRENEKATIVELAPKRQQGRGDGSVRDNLRAWEAAEYLGISGSTLAKLRMRHNRSKGPNYIKSGGVIIYRRDDFDIWLESQVIGGKKDA